MKPIVVVVEGVDGVGKTTLSKCISEKLGMFYLYTPQPPLSFVRKEVEALRNFETRFFYYLASVVAVQDLIKDKLTDNISVVMDRYIYSTFVMHKYLGVDTSCVSMSQLPIKKPDVGILLTSSTGVRESRIKDRTKVAICDNRIEQLSSVLDMAQDGYREFSELYEINSDSLTEKQVFEKASLLIKKKGERK